MNQSQSSTSIYLPNLPGFKPHDRKSGTKKKFFERIGGFSVMKYEEPKQDSLMSNGLESQSVLSIGTSTRNKARAFTPLEPEIKTILTFQSYFEEGVDGSKPLVRKCIISFYEEDSTMQIVEKPTKNSGLLQGTIMKRTALTKPDGNPYNVYDFQLGSELIIYGRRYRLVDCDAFTRNYITSLTQDENRPGSAIPPESYEDEPGPEDGEDSFKRQKNANSAYQAALLGVGVDNSGRAGFVTYGGMKLNFLCVWDNTEMLYGDELEFSMAYSLADDTLEIFSVSAYNSGRDETFSRLLKKAKLPKSLGTHILSGGDPVEAVYYTWTDLYLGMQLPVYGRILKIVDCDEQTRRFYRDEGYELGPPARKAKIPAIIKEAPPVGQSWSSIGVESSEPKKRGGEAVQNTYRAKLLSGGEDDVNREFIITYYCIDDSIQILEPAIRNSGFWGGTFLKRMKVRNANGSYIQETEFWIGKDIQILKHRFRLYEADEGTLKYMDNNCHKYPRSDIILIFDKIRPVMKEAAESGELRKMFESMERIPGSGYFDKKGIETIFSNFGLYDSADQGAQSDPSKLSEHEIVILNRKTTFQSMFRQLEYKYLIAEVIEHSGSYH